MAKFTIQYNPNYSGDVKVFVLANSEFNLEKINFRPLGVEIYKMFSKGFKDYFTRNSFKVRGKVAYEYNIVFFNDILRKQIEQSKDEDLYVVVPRYLKSNTNNASINKTLEDAYRLLQISKPSTLHIKYAVHFKLSGRFLNREMLEEYPDRSRFAYPRSKFSVKSNAGIERLIVRYARMKPVQYIETAMQAFSACFEVNYYAMQYINLVMSMECFIPGKNEVTYRMRRGLSVLCGRGLKSSEFLYSNLSKIYNLRSSIVHGKEYSVELVHKYLPYTIVLCAKYLRVLIVYGIDNSEKLDSIITQSGFKVQSSGIGNIKVPIIDKESEDILYSHLLPKK